MKIKTRTWFTAFVFLFSLIIYFLTAARDVTFTDSGELAGVCATLGVAHPTGYPLFTILGYLWTKLPLPFSTIFSLNIFVAVLTALSVAVFYNILYLIIKNAVPETKSVKQKGTKAKSVPPVMLQNTDTTRQLVTSAIGALLYAFAATIWEQATSIEVYSLQLLLVNLIILTFLSGVYNKNYENRYFLLSAFLIGLGFTNHMTTLLLLPGLFFLYFKRPNEPFDFSPDRLKMIAIMAVPFMLGLSVYLYLPLRASTFPDFNWGWVSRSWDKFYYHVSGKQYQLWMFSGSESFSENFNKFIASIPSQLSWIGIIGLAAGLYGTYKLSRELAIFLILLVIGCLAYALNYSIHDIETYFSIAYISMLLIAGIGFYYFGARAGKYYPLLVIIPLVSLFTNYAENDKSEDYLVPEYTRIMIDNLQPNAIIFSRQWDYFCSAFWYKQKVEGYRPDVVLIEKELLRRTWYLEQFRRWYPQTADLSRKEMNAYLADLELFEADKPYNAMSIQANFVNILNSFIDKNYDKRPIYVTLDILEDAGDRIGEGYEKIPEGFAFRLEKEKSNYPVSVDKINIDKFNKSLVGREDHLSQGIKNIASLNLANLGRYALATGQRYEAEKAFRKALRIDPGNEFALQGLQMLSAK